MYDSDLSDEEWGLIKHHFQRQDNRGAQSDAYQARCDQRYPLPHKVGAQWRMLASQNGQCCSIAV